MRGKKLTHWVETYTVLWKTIIVSRTAVCYHSFYSPLDQKKKKNSCYFGILLGFGSILLLLIHKFYEFTKKQDLSIKAGF